MDERPRNLRAMLAEAKDTSELMVDLAYASVYFDDPDMAEEVDELEHQMSELVHDMRAVCVLAARSPREAEGMSSVLQVVSAIERIANDAVDISHIVTRRMGIPRQLVADLSDEIDDPRASHLLASAKFMLARERYRAIDGENADAQVRKEAIILEVMETVNADYERALRGDTDDRFEYKWNYDLTSNPEAIRRALEAPREIEPPELEQMKGEGTPVRRRRG
mgnify:CR=1 FL=1